MNNKRRSAVRDVIKALTKAGNDLSDIAFQEQDCIDNMPENLQMSEQVEKMEDCVNGLQESASMIDEAINVALDVIQ